MRKCLFLSVALLVFFSGFQLSSLAASSLPAGTSSVPEPAKVTAALSEFRSLSKKEKKERLKEVKKAVKDYKKTKRNNAAADTDTLLLVILAILLPPLAVYLHEGEINTRFWISLLLTLLFWIPGVIYALIIILGDN